jgi:hypothetical protein
MMHATITADGKPVKLNRFIAELTASILDAVARSLKYTNGRTVEFRMRGETVTMFIDGNDVSLHFGSASRIVRDVLQGLVKNLYGTESATEIALICDRTPAENLSPPDDLA